MRSLAVILMAGLAISCGVVGPPVAPETIGAAPLIERQKQQHQQEALEAQQREKQAQEKQQQALEVQQRENAAAAEAAESDPDLQGHEVELPPLQPVETR
ncbi:MAG: hypothetical protein ACT4O4_11810 [Nitrospiraceae bacterium]